jgi:hypothetical protein
MQLGSVFRLGNPDQLADFIDLEAQLPSSMPKHDERLDDLMCARGHPVDGGSWSFAQVRQRLKAWPRFGLFIDRLARMAPRKEDTVILVSPATVCNLVVAMTSFSKHRGVQSQPCTAESERGRASCTPRNAEAAVRTMGFLLQ